MPCYVYIMCSQSRNALYVGMSSNLAQRVEQHRLGTAGSHTARYRIRRLIWFEAHDDPGEALARERRIKRWRRDWKEALISASNPDWRDLSIDIPY
ncbi:MAG: GIY-YIG nuclease family protein [Pseudomonadota bacterium]|nr:GIY-YIG nuclease family protein [Pseudomonadota bacterium]